MAIEAQTKDQSSSQKEFEALLNEDFKDRKLVENEIIKATVTEVNNKYVIVDAKAKAEAMIPIEEFKKGNIQRGLAGMGQWMGDQGSRALSNISILASGASGGASACAKTGIS